MKRWGNILIIGGIIAAVYSFLTRKPAEAAPTARKAPPDGLGDVDMDGWVTEKDAVLVANYVAKKITLTAEQLRRADVNGDGRVTAVDALFIAQYAKWLRDDNWQLIVK